MNSKIFALLSNGKEEAGGNKKKFSKGLFLVLFISMLQITLFVLHFTFLY